MSNQHQLAARKAAVRELLSSLADLAAATGLESTAHDIRQVRIPKLDQGRFSLVVLGEFNHGKSTLINALLPLHDPWSVDASPAQPASEPFLPVGITPTTAVLTLIRHGEQAAAEAAAMAELRGMEAGGTAEDIEVPEEELSVSAELAEMKRKLRK